MGSWIFNVTVVEDDEYPLPLRDYTSEFEAALEDAIDAADRLTDYWGNDDWMDMIDRDRLEMESPSRCVLGQLGKFPQIKRNGPWSLSALVGMRGFFEGGIYDYKDLTEAWLEIL